MMAASKTILLTAGSGNIGRALTPLLLSKSPTPTIILPTSSEDGLKTNNKAAANDSTGKVIIEVGSVRDPIWFESLLTKHDVDAVFLCLTGTDELFTVMNCLDAMSRTGTVKKLVYLSISGDFTSEVGAKNVFRDRGYPHLFPKVVAEQRLIHHKYPFNWTVLGPPFFFNNDFRLKVPIMEMGIYGEPNLEKGGSKVSIDDIALAACNLFFDSSGKWHGKKIQMGSRHSYTTEESAKLWSDAIGKPLQTQPATKDTMDAFEQNLRGAMGPGLDGLAWARDIRVVYEYSIAKGIPISEEDYQLQVQLLGKEPSDYGEWVRTIAALWTQEK